MWRDCQREREGEREGGGKSTEGMHLYMAPPLSCLRPQKSARLSSAMSRWHMKEMLRHWRSEVGVRDALEQVARARIPVRDYLLPPNSVKYCYVPSWLSLHASPLRMNAFSLDAINGI